MILRCTCVINFIMKLLKYIISLECMILEKICLYTIDDNGIGIGLTIWTSRKNLVFHNCCLQLVSNFKWQMQLKSL